jgi:amino acid transporter
MSAANSDLYIGSRTLYGLALEGKAPRIFRRVNKMGVPWPALLFCTAFCFLVFLNTAKGASKVFGYFVNLVSTFGAITWSESRSMIREVCLLMLCSVHFVHAH